MIAACLPNPKRYTVKPLSALVKRRYPWVEKQMANLQSDPDIKLLLVDGDSPVKKASRKNKK
jgi:monofunctional glycosyltransferase